MSYKEKPLKGKRIAACLHVTAETANLIVALKVGGADAYLCASNPLSTQDDIASALVKNYNIPVFAVKGESDRTYYKHVNEVLDIKPQITMDDGADLVAAIVSKRKDLLEHVIGETTTGVARFRAMAKDKMLPYPVIAVNDAATKHFFDNRYGNRAIDDRRNNAGDTNVLFAGKVVVTVPWATAGAAGNLQCGQKGLVHTSYRVTEVDHIKAIEAAMDGFEVMAIKEAAKKGDIFVTLTGNLNVITAEHFMLMKDGTIVCNSGHFNNEIDLKSLKKLSKSSKISRDFMKNIH